MFLRLVRLTDLEPGVMPLLVGYVMKLMWCWRCKLDVPMLDEEEFAVVGKLYSEGMGATREFRQKHNLPLGECPIDDRFRPVREAYERMTGMAESNHNAIMHHRIAIYGSPCERCDKPLRTPRANVCAACGQVRSSGPPVNGA